MYRIELQNKETKEITVFNNLEDLNYGEKLYFKFLIKTIEMADGEYTLNLYEDDFIIHTDTLRIGDFDVKGIQYKKGENLFVDTTLTARTEVKEIELDITKKNIYPSAGIDAMTKVVVNAQPVYDNGYNAGRTEGYNTGKADGYNEGYETGVSESYDIGYNKGAEDGYKTGYDKGAEDGFTNGVNEQKSKLTNISITENGRYENEDGYNLIDVNVKGEIEIENTQVLNVTENGTYATDYSKIEDIYDTGVITGYFDDNTPFYGYAHLTNISFDTNYGIRDRIELWWKADGNYNYRNSTAGICGESDNDYTYSIYIQNYSGIPKLYGKIGTQRIETELVENKWYHFILSEDEGFIVNGEKIGDFNNPNAGIDIKAFINESYYLYEIPGMSNGYFGMVKLDDNIFIPTENGFINYITNTPLEIHREGTYEYTELPAIESNLIRTVNVNVAPKINMQKEGLKFAFTQITNIPEWVDWSGITNMERMFSYSTIAEIPVIDTSSVTNMSNMFYSCSNLTTIPELDTSSVTNMSSMFYSCTNLTTVPELDTSNVTNISYMFYSCRNLTAIPQLDTSKVENFSYFINGCTKLVSVPALNASKVTTMSNFCGTTNLTNITYFGGLIGLKASMTGNEISKMPNLNYESCINVLNGLYDFTGNGETPSSSQGKLKVHSNFLNLVGDEIAIGTNKGWVITA